jgi:hypothetical protein
VKNRASSAGARPSASALERLRAAYQAGEVCLFVGAGVSIGCGLPGWEELARDVIDLIPRKPGPIPGAVSAAVRAGRKPPPVPDALRDQKADILKMMNPLLSMRYARCYARSEPDIDLPLLVSDRLYRARLLRARIPA